MAANTVSGRNIVSSKPDRARIIELDGLRGIAIILVLLTHFYPATGFLAPLGPYLRAGWAGVDLFFVLSGFLITGILLDAVEDRRYYSNFILRRTLRIFPLYYLCLPLYCVLIALCTPEWKALAASKAPWWFAAYAGNLQEARRSAWPAGWLFGPLWSLQVEEQFYLTFPLLVARLKPVSLAKVLVAAFVLAPALRVALYIFRPHNFIAAYVLMPCRMDALAMGGLIAIVRREAPHWLKQRWIGGAAAISGLAFCAICAAFTAAPRAPAMRMAGYSLLAVLFGSTLILLVFQRQKHLLRVCRIKFMVWLGTISYGLYLLQLPAAMVTRYFSGRILHVAEGSTADSALCLLAAVLAAWLSWVLFESPILKLKGRLAP